ncbi:APC5 protein [Coemansia sp. BCRC 34301]|nr:APC5 protein [Coemansia sp. BCRC 34301]
MAFSAYLSAPKLVLLVGVDLYSRRYDWGPMALSDLAQFLVRHMCSAGSASSWERLRQELDLVLVRSECQTLRQLVGHQLSCVQSVDELHWFFDRARQLVVDAEDARTRALARADSDSMKLDSESMLGIFVRRCSLAFDQLEFHQISTLFDEWRRAAVAIGDDDDDAGTLLEPAQKSRVEAEEAVEQQIALLEAGEINSTSASKVCIAGHARSHYLAYLDGVSSGESERALAELRRFFDSSDSRTTHQAALLNLAGMHAQVGMVGRARLALAEATHVAHDSQDHACLLYVQCWETRLLLDEGNAAAALQAASALMAKAADLGNRELLATGSIYVADALLLGGAGPWQAFEAAVAARALVVELGVARLSNAWWQMAARVWAQYGGDRVGELHKRMVWAVDGKRGQAFQAHGLGC